MREELPVRVLKPALADRFVAQVIRVLQEEQAVGRSSAESKAPVGPKLPTLAEAHPEAPAPALPKACAKPA